MNNNKLVIFDLDGTLNRTELYAVPAHKKALADYGIFNITDEFIISTFGARGMDTAPLLIGSTDESTCKEYLQKASMYERELIADYAGEYEGVTDLLTKLKNKGYQTAVCSNASERYIRMVLDTLKLTHLIDFIQPLLPDLSKNDTLELLLKKIQPEKAIMVGDRIYDKLAAIHNEIPFIGCLYGFNQSEVADADYPVTCVSDIYNSIKYAMSTM